MILIPEFIPFDSQFFTHEGSNTLNGNLVDGN